VAKREFARDSRGYVFMSDERDIATPVSKRQEVYAWAGANGITVEYQGSLGGFDVWRVRDEQQRAWFLLRWA
jgi:CRISPR/Cas system CMR subunit Cmr4 (Cas7 group RAMP superfamily)